MIKSLKKVLKSEEPSVVANRWLFFHGYVMKKFERKETSQPQLVLLNIVFIEKA